MSDEVEDEDKALEERVRRLSPTRVARAWACPHFFYLEEFGDQSKRAASSAGQTLDRERGLRFEQSVVQSLAGVEEPAWDQENLAKGFEATKRLMERGAPWIHGAVLIGSGLVGVADLLQRRTGRSRLGDFTYVPVEVKNHKEVQRRDILQVVGYAQALADVLGGPCVQGGVWLNTNVVAEIEIAEHLPLFQETIRQIECIRAGQEKTEPVWCGSCSNCPWLSHCKDEWVRLDHLSLLPNGGRSTVAKLYPLGIRTATALAQADPEAIARDAPMTKAAALKLWNHARARLRGEPIQIKRPEFTEDMPRIFYDIETYGGGTIFLHGLIRVFGNDREERFFFAEAPGDEAGVWHEFLDYLAREDRAVVWCWADYERSNAEQCWTRHGGNDKGYRVLMDGLVDQCRWTSEHFAFPTRSYSIKAVAPALGFHWKAKDAGGLNCEAWYGEWLRGRNVALREKILEYNRDDVLAMEIVYDRLKALSQREAGGKS